jgi:hypothetical protein
VSEKLIEFEHRENDVPTPVTSIVLANARSGATYGVRRQDTQAIVVAAGTPLVLESGSVANYQYNVTGLVGGVVYEYGLVWEFDGDTDDLFATFTAEADPEAGGWYYADQEAVEDLIGSAALRLISNEPGAASSSETDTERVQRVGEQMDAWIDARLTALGFVAPVQVGGADLDTVDSTHATRQLLRETSAKLVAYTLNEPRLLMSLSAPTVRNPGAIDVVMETHRKSAEMTLNKLAWRQLSLIADRLYDRPPYAKVFVPE